MSENCEYSGGAVGDQYQILNFFGAAPNRKTFIFKTLPPSSRTFRTTIGNGTSTGVRHYVAYVLEDQYSNWLLFTPIPMLNCIYNYEN